MTVLQVAANPYVSVLGSPRGAASRLNLSQAFNSFGTAIAPMIGAIFILSDNILSSEEIDVLSVTEKMNYFDAEASAVQGPFIALALCLLALALFVAVFKLPKVLNEKSVGTYAEVLREPRLMLGAVGIFVYVGAEVAIGSYQVNYFLDMDMVGAIKGNSMMSDIAKLRSQQRPE